MLPLYERISPSTALITIGQSTLLPFRVDNRKNMYVYRDQQGHIHYLLLTTEHTSPNSQQHMLVLTAHGVDQPGTEITKDLRETLQSKLNATALMTISNLIGRNPTFQMTQSDLDFVCAAGRAQRQQSGATQDTKRADGADDGAADGGDGRGGGRGRGGGGVASDGNSHVDYPIDVVSSHAGVGKRGSEPNHEMSVQVPSMLKSAVSIRRVIDLLSSASQTLMRVLRLSPVATKGFGRYDLALVYNYSPTAMAPASSVATSMVGRGVAIIQVCIVREQHAAEKKDDAWPDVWRNDFVVISDGNDKQEVDDDRRGGGAENESSSNIEKEHDSTVAPTTLKVKVWAAGSVNVSMLIQHFEIFVHQAVHQHALETYYWKRPIQKYLFNLHDLWMNSIFGVMDSALALGTSDV